MRFVFSPWLAQQLTWFVAATLLAFLLGEKMIHHAGQFLSIYLPQDITIGGHTRKARAGQLQRLGQRLLALAYPLGYSAQTGFSRQFRQHNQR